ncbi:hypothetical protein D6833_09235 [Candidatus Parcubacteria bacterium]|nr:MAG: hypothetical protein D6833_09235 [Candidatus Parcubacteria bacterium]
MSTELLNWVHDYLERDEDIVVPIKKMWNEWVAMHGAPSLEEFTALVLSDERFEEMPGVDYEEDPEWLTPEERIAYEQNMEEMGFFSGPRVKLKRREITLEHIARMIKKHNDRAEKALQAAREAMPEDLSEEEEELLIEAIEKLRRLREHLRELGLDE